MAHGAYSPLKVFHHADKLEQLRIGVQPVPAQVQLVISDLCNHDCSFCSYRMSGYSANQLFGVERPDGTVNNNPNRMIPLEKCIEIINDCHEMGVKAIQITGGGEPTVHPGHEAIFHAVIRRGIELAVVTNGARFKETTAEHLAQAKWVRFSLDAGRPETYAAIRSVSPDTMGRVLANLREVVALRQQHGSDTRIGAGFVVTADNWREVVDAAQLAKGAGADNFRMSAIFQNDGAEYFKDFFEPAAALCRYAETLASDGFEVHNLFGERVEDLEQASPDYSFCGYQHFNTYIGADLNVYRCCVLAYNERGHIGSLKEQRFRDLWASQQKRDDFDSFDAKGCPQCPFNSKNRTILYAIDPHPADANFV